MARLRRTIDCGDCKYDGAGCGQKKCPEVRNYDVKSVKEINNGEAYVVWDEDLDLISLTKTEVKELAKALGLVVIEGDKS